MRGVTAGVELLVRCTAAVRTALGLGALVRAMAVSAIVAALASTSAEPSVVVGVLGTLLVAWAVARNVAVLPAVTGIGPVVAARDHHRALARRPVPRHRDPDAAGHTRSRAPSELSPAV